MNATRLVFLRTGERDVSASGQGRPTRTASASIQMPALTCPWAIIDRIADDPPLLRLQGAHVPAAAWTWPEQLVIRRGSTGGSGHDDHEPTLATSSRSQPTCPPSPIPGCDRSTPRMGDLLRPRADDRRGDPPAGRAAPGRGPRRLRLRQVLAGARRRSALAGARPCRLRRAMADGDRAPSRRPSAQHRGRARQALGPPTGRHAGDPQPSGTTASPSAASACPTSRRARRPGAMRLCLLVDQFEELFR